MPSSSFPLDSQVGGLSPPCLQGAGRLLRICYMLLAWWHVCAILDLGRQRQGESQVHGQP